MDDYPHCLVASEVNLLDNIPFAKTDMSRLNDKRYIPKRIWLQRYLITGHHKQTPVTGLVTVHNRITLHLTVMVDWPLTYLNVELYAFIFTLQMYCCMLILDCYCFLYIFFWTFWFDTIVRFYLCDVTCRLPQRKGPLDLRANPKVQLAQAKRFATGVLDHYNKNKKVHYTIYLLSR